MKKIKLYMGLAALVPIWMAACKKTAFSGASGGTSLTLVNAVVNSNGLVTNLTPVGGKEGQPLQWYATANQVYYQSFVELSGYSGATALSLSDITDTSLAVWSGTLNLQMNSIYSFYVIGADTAHIDTLFTQDNLSYHPPTDSSVGVRFINVAPGSNAVSVDIQGNAPGSTVASLAYKGVTSFTDFAANSTVDSYTFEFRDAVSGTLLASDVISGLSNGTGTNTSNNNYRYRNITIALEGTLSSGYAAVEVDDY